MILSMVILGFGNIIVSQDGLQSIIDWELAHVGNPLQDLGWICGNSWRFGNTDKVIGGFGDLKTFWTDTTPLVNIRLIY